MMKLDVSVWIIASVLSLNIHSIQGKTCNDTLAGNVCQHLAKHNACYTHPEEMKKLCSKACDFCGSKTPCHGMVCPYRQICSITADYKPYCRCFSPCTSATLTGPLCARNRKTYSSLCKLQEDECRLGKLIQVHHYGKCIERLPCSDVFASRCKQFKNDGLCVKQQMMMQFYCAKTCRLCRQPAPPPACTRSKFGCCWNSNNAALGWNQEGCYACKERGFCRNFIPMCGGDRNRQVMRELCPRSCGYCQTAASVEKKKREVL